MGSTSRTEAGGRVGGRRGKPVSKRRLMRRARDLVKEARGLLKRKGKRVTEAAREAVSAQVDAVTALVPSRRNRVEYAHDALYAAAVDLDNGLTTHFARYRKSVTRELVEAVAWAVGLALIIRFFLIEAFSIPSGSMIPTLEIGDHLFINKIGYGLYWPLSAARAVEWGQPDPGDVIVFEHDSPGDRHHGKDYIKRVIAVPGDRVRLEGNVVHINGRPIPTEVIGEFDCPIFYDENAEEPWMFCRCVRQRETLGGTTFVTQHIIDRRSGCRSDAPRPEDWPHRLRPAEGRYFGYEAVNPNWPDVVVPEGHVFVMGDNRDRSEDGRYWGFVANDKIKGSAFLIWWARDKGRLFSWID